jgi:hypothetical protein
MPVGNASGYPNYAYEGLSKLIPILWAADAREKFYASTCLPDITNQNILGAAEIKNMGDRIWINTVPDVPINDYVRGELLNVDYLESPAIEMTVDYAKQFNFAVDEIDLKQVKIKDWISRYAEDANKQMKIHIETKVLAGIYGGVDAANTGLTAGKISANINLGTVASPLTLTKSNVLSKIIQCSQVLGEQNIPKDGQWWMVIPEAMSTVLQDSDLKNVSMTGDSSSVMRNKGLLGEISRFKLYESNLLPMESDGSYHILFGHRMAIWFVSQYTKVKMYEPERGFAQAMKGLNVYGYGVLQPTAMGQMVASISYS